MRSSGANEPFGRAEPCASQRSAHQTRWAVHHSPFVLQCADVHALVLELLGVVSVAAVLRAQVGDWRLRFAAAIRLPLSVSPKHFLLGFHVVKPQTIILHAWRAPRSRRWRTSSRRGRRPRLATAARRIERLDLAGPRAVGVTLARHGKALLKPSVACMTTVTVWGQK